METMNTDEHDELWRLLEKAKKPQVSPFFARNILREVRTIRQSRSSLFFRLPGKWRLAVPAGAALIVLGISVATSLQKPAPVNTPARSQQTVAEYDTINHLDELLAYEENSIWLDNSSY